MEDKFIVRNIKKRDEIGIEMVINKYGGFIKAIVIKKLYGNGEAYDECVNDVLMCIWKSIDTFDERKNTFKNWIASVTRYKVIDYNRKYLKSLDRVSHMDEDRFNQIKDSKAQVEGDILKRELREEINNLLDNLKKEDKRLFIKHYLEDASIEELGGEFGVNTANIYNRLSRGRSKLRKLLNGSILGGEV